MTIRTLDEHDPEQLTPNGSPIHGQGKPIQPEGQGPSDAGLPDTGPSDGGAGHDPAGPLPAQRSAWTSSPRSRDAGTIARSGRRWLGALLLPLLVTGGVVSGCASSPSAPVADASAPQALRYGRVEDVQSVDRAVEGSNRRSIPGAVVGGVIGGVLGHQIGGGRGNDVATAAGAVGGAVAGSRIGGGERTERLIEYTVRLDDGQVVRVLQADDIGVSRNDRVGFDGVRVRR